jgi:hypothetical protein
MSSGWMPRRRTSSQGSRETNREASARAGAFGHSLAVGDLLLPRPTRGVGLPAARPWIFHQMVKELPEDPFESGPHATKGGAPSVRVERRLCVLV